MTVVVIAPNSFKGSASAEVAANAIATGLRRVWPDADLRLRPMADGGDGTLDAVLSRGGARRHARVAGAAGAPRAAGTLATHYAPRTPARLMRSPELADALAQLSHPGAHIAVLAHSVEQPPEFEGTWFDAPTHDTAYAQKLYANLRALDALAADEIWIEAPPDGPEWHAVRDRLRRATDRAPRAIPGRPAAPRSRFHPRQARRARAGSHRGAARKPCRATVRRTTCPRNRAVA